MRPIGGFFVVLTGRNCRELWRRCAVFITGQSVARWNKAMICPRMSHFVRFVGILGKKTTIAVLIAVTELAWESTGQKIAE